jgi:tetratricopeptide (TPR) repeat protein
VERWMAGEPVSARREPWHERARRWLGRHRTVLAAAVAATVVAVLGLATVLVVQARANTDLRSGNERLRAAVARETKVKELGLAAIRRSYSGAAADPLLKEARLLGLRRSLLGTALDFYQQLGTVLKDGQDDRTQAELAGAYTSIGKISSEIGSNADALRAYQQALVIREGLTRSNPGVPAYTAALAATLNDIGPEQRALGRLDEELRSYRRAREIGEAQAAPDAATRRELARTYLLTANTLTERQAAEALALFEKGRAILEDLVRSDPADAATRGELAQALNGIGLQLLLLGRTQDAARSFEAMPIVLRPLAAADPPDVTARLIVATSYANLGRCYEVLGRADDAAAAYQRAMEIYGPLGASDPALVRVQIGAITSLLNIGWSQRQMGRPDEAVATCRQALEIAEACVANDPNQPRYKRWRCTAYDAIGRTSEAMGRYGEALDAYRRAETDAASLAADPQVSNKRLGMDWLADIYGSIARVHRKTGLADQSLEFVRKGLEVRESMAVDPDVAPSGDASAMNQTRIGVLQRQLGRPAEAARSFQKARSFYQGKLAGADLYNLACVESLSSELAGVAEGLTPSEQAEVAGAADRAVDLVRRAIAAGFRDLVNMNLDTDLDPIRSRPDFQLLMMDLAFPADPFGR